MFTCNKVLFSKSITFFSHRHEENCLSFFVLSMVTYIGPCHRSITMLQTIDILPGYLLLMICFLFFYIFMGVWGFGVISHVFSGGTMEP